VCEFLCREKRASNGRTSSIEFHSRYQAHEIPEQYLGIHKVARICPTAPRIIKLRCCSMSLISPWNELNLSFGPPNCGRHTELFVNLSRFYLKRGGSQPLNAQNLASRDCSPVPVLPAEAKSRGHARSRGFFGSSQSSSHVYIGPFWGRKDGAIQILITVSGQKAIWIEPSLQSLFHSDRPCSSEGTADYYALTLLLTYLNGFLTLQEMQAKDVHISSELRNTNGGVARPITTEFLKTDRSHERSTRALHRQVGLPDRFARPISAFRRVLSGRNLRAVMLARPGYEGTFRP
jgi:hypothetical protein